MHCTVLAWILLILTAPALAAQPRTATDELMAHYRFDSPSGQTVTDLSGNGRHGRIEGTVEWANGGLQLDGTGFVIIPADEKLSLGTGGFTFELLLAFDRFPDPKVKAAFVASYCVSDVRYGCGVDVTSRGAARFYARTPAGTFIYVDSVPLPVRELLHIVGTRDEDRAISLYVNGRLQDSAPGAAKDYRDPVAIFIGGAEGAGIADRLAGNVKDFRLYARAVADAGDDIVKRGLQYRDIGSRLEGDTTMEPLPELGKPNAHGLSVLDRQIRYLDGPADQPATARPLPVGESAMTTKVPALPLTIPSPYPGGGTENIYFSRRRSLTANVLQEPGKPWILQLGIATPHTGDTLEGAQTYRTWYRVSNDGGQTFSALKPAVQQGDEYDLMHPFAGVWTGKNSCSVDFTRPVVRASNGEVMVPFGFWPLDDSGKLYNPSSAFTYWDVGMLIGRWADDGSDMIWDLGDWIRMDPEKSPRGLEEPTVVELRRQGHFMLVARGSNETTNRAIPGYKWMSFSRDYCRTWSAPEPFKYADGTNFFSPNSCSALVRSRKNGRIYWIGNISGKNTDGNGPRYPLVIGEVDEEKCGLIRKSVLVLDTRNPEYDSRRMQLSNFHVYEDTDTGTLTVMLARFDRAKSGEWEGAPCWYAIGVPQE